MAPNSNNVVWKHIGLHGHSVGTFACENDKIVWKSAIMGREDEPAQSTVRSIPAAELTAAKWTVFGKSGHLRLLAQSAANVKHELRLDGFPTSDFDVLKTTLQDKYGIDLQPHSMSASGTQYGLTAVRNKNLVFRHCMLDEMNEEGQEFEPRAADEMMSLDLAQVSQCVLPGNSRNEIEVQFPESDTVEAGTDQLVAIRFYIPPDPDADPADKEAATAAEHFQHKIMQIANIRKTTGDVIVSFDQTKGTFLTPRGRYAIQLFDSFLRMRGQKYDYKIRYDDINRLFLLPKPDEVHMAFVIALDKPIRQGQQRYQYLVLQAVKEPDEVTVNLDEETLQKEYGGELQPVMRGSLSNLIAKTFKVIARKKVFIPGKFATSMQQACVKCAVRANEGLLYPLEKQFVFIHKPPILIRFNEVESVEFQRYAGGQGSTRNFDFCVNLKSSVTAGQNKEYVFSGIDRSDYAGLYNFLSGKKITIKNLQDSGIMEESQGAKGPVYNEDEIYGGPDNEMLEESEDEDYDEKAAAADEEESEEDSDELDDDEIGSEVDEDVNSDLEGKGGKKKKKRKAAAKKSDDETPKKRKKKAKKDPNAPKRALTAYMYFVNASRDNIKKENPDASFGELGKLLGAKWKTISAEEKVPFQKMAAEDKERYQKEMKDYKPPEESASPKSGKKKKKDPNAPKRATTSFLFFSNEMRPKIKAENPDLTFGELGKRIGEMFRALSAEEKEKYEQKAKADKERYKKAVSEYKASQANENSDDDDDDSDEGDKKPKAKSDSDDDDSDEEGLKDDDDDDDSDSDDDSSSDSD